MTELRLYMAQRLSALVMVPLVLGHIAVMIHASQGGLTAAEILSRTQGSVFWALFYGTFVLAVSVHAALGLRNILREWAGLAEPLLSWTSLAIGVGLAILGLRAVYNVTGSLG